MSKKVLIIDDDADVRGLMKIRLEGNGLIAFTAADGEEGLKICETEKPNLIIVDVMMPKIDGYTLVREIKSNPFAKDIPIIVLSGRTGMKDLFEIEGVQDFVPKPYDANDLVKKVFKYIK